MSVPQFVRIQGVVKTPDPKIPWEGALRVGLLLTVWPSTSNSTVNVGSSRSSTQPETGAVPVTVAFGPGTSIDPNGAVCPAALLTVTERAPTVAVRLPGSVTRIANVYTPLLTAVVSHWNVTPGWLAAQ